MNNEKKETLVKILKYYLISRIFLVIMMLILNHFLKIKFPDIKNVLYLFDNEHFLDMAKNGIRFEYQYSFMPLTSIVIRYLGMPLTLILNQILAILSAYLIYLIGDKYLNIDNPIYPAILWLVSPIALFTLMFYSEAMFMFFTLFAYYLYRKKKYYFILGITMGLAVATRSLGSMLFFSIFICMMIRVFKKKENIKNVFITYIPATIISCIYPIYLYFRTKRLFAFVDVEYTYWGRIHTNIFRILYDATYGLIHDMHPIYLLNYIITFFLIGYVIYLIIKGRKNKKQYDIYLYMIFTILIMCSSIRANGDAVTSFYRYIFGCFPIYFMLPRNRYVAMCLCYFTAFISTFFLLNMYFY